VSLFLAGAGGLGIVVTILVHKLTTNDPYGLKAARREAALRASGNLTR
jgi:hypothetical protein